jgi:pSer/pThr/pTyr-binding forkhead associated (FHA) protein
VADYPPAAAALSVRRGPGAGTRFQIEAPAVTIGRHAQCDFQVDDRWLSRQHARITWTGIGYALEDLGSTNGTYLNGERVSGPRGLNPGDVVQLGEEVELVFEVAAPERLERPAPVWATPRPASEAVAAAPAVLREPALDESARQQAGKTATGALTSAIVGLFICGIILEPVAIAQARKARKTLKAGDPGYGRAVAAEIIAWIGLCLWVVALIYQAGNM